MGVILLWLLLKARKTVSECQQKLKLREKIFSISRSDLSEKTTSEQSCDGVLNRFSVNNIGKRLPSIRKSK